MRAGIALGSNVGDRLGNLRRARAEIAALHRGEEPMRCSRIYETEPVDCEPGTPFFLNAAVEIEFEGRPHELLASLRAIEKKFARGENRLRNAPRTLDLDIVFFGSFVLADPALTLPHPRMFERRFVLVPLADIHPELILPGQSETVAQLLAKLPREPRVTPAGSTF
jgi:2-amino-4-hydroxy-6-hydroxymethyldihydropteridine diphosphokinase